MEQAHGGQVHLCPKEKWTLEFSIFQIRHKYKRITFSSGRRMPGHYLNGKGKSQ